MKILYVTQFFKPELVAAAFRAYDNARIWNGKGVETVIFTGYPNFPTGKLFEGYEIKTIDIEYIDGIKVIRNKINIKPNTSKINRIINSLSFLFYGIYNIIFNNKKIGNNYDVVLGTTGTLLAPIIAYVYSVLKKIPFVLEIRDITYIQALAVYEGEKNMLFKIIKFIELYLCKKAKKIVVVTNGFKEELIKNGVSKNKIEVIFNGIDSSEIKVAKVLNNEEIVFSYMGNLGKSQNLIQIIDVFKNIKLKKYSKKLFIIGEGAEKENIKKYIKTNRILNVIVKDAMNGEKLEKYYDLSDFCIVSLKNNEYFKHTVPSKIFHILGRGKEIVYFGPKGEASQIIQEINNDFIFTHDNFDDVVSKLNILLNARNLKKSKKKYREYIEKNFDREELANKYIEILKVITKKIKN